MDWGKELPFDNTISKRYDFSYVSFGWGDKGFYLDTPSWAELQPSTAFVAAFGLENLPCIALIILRWKKVKIVRK
jgi:hypothetical protein